MLLREPKTPNITEHRTKLNGLSKFILCSNHSRLQQKTAAVFACFYSQHFSCTWSIKNVIEVALFSKCLKLVSKLRADFLLSQKLLAAILLQKKSIMKVLAANSLMILSIVRIVCDCFCHDRKASLKYLR